MITTELHQQFKVEYDKANVISAYPTFLPEEIDVWLNKGYSMLISQKFTGNNFRQIAFEGDIKRIDDLQNLINSTEISTHTMSPFVANGLQFNLASVTDYLHYITANIKLDGTVLSEVILTQHELTQRVKETGINKPWIPRPISSLANDILTVYYDTIDNPDVANATLMLTYLSKPAAIDVLTAPNAAIEVSDNTALELVNLAVLLALENIESQRIQTKNQTITLQE